MDSKIKDFLPFLALMLSVTGMGLSFFREEARCYLQLSSACHSTNETDSSQLK